MKHRTFNAFVISAALVFLAPLVLTACGDTPKPKPEFLSTDVSGVNFGEDFRLTDHNGNVRTLSDFKGKVVVLFFGYTHCPDVCPATMSNLATAMEKLGPDAARVQVLFVTVDPERDTPPVLQQYLSSFNPTFLGLSGNAQATKAVTKEFKIVAQKQPGEAAGHHTVDHSTGTYIFDTNGKLRLYVTSDKDADVFAHDISELLKTSA